MTQPACGQVPASALVPVQSGTYLGLAYTIRLETVTARQYLAAKAAHPSLMLAPPLGGYRSYQDQKNLKADPAAYGSTLPDSQIQNPDTGTWTHGWGTCLDVVPGEPNDWFAANCSRFGFVWESPAGEMNHYRQTAPTWAAVSLAAESIKVVPGEPKEPEMFIVAMQSATYRNGRWLVAPGYVHGFTPAEWNDWGQNLQAAGVWVFTPPTDAGFDSLLSLLTTQRYVAGRGDLAPDKFTGAATPK